MSLLRFSTVFSFCNNTDLACSRLPRVIPEAVLSLTKLTEFTDVVCRVGMVQTITWCVPA